MLGLKFIHVSKRGPSVLATVFKIKTWDWQVLRRTDNFFRIALLFHVYASPYMLQDWQLFWLKFEHWLAMDFPYHSLALNRLWPRQNGCYLTDIFKCIFLNENVWISLKISLKFVPKVRITNIPAMVQIMAWHRPGANPLSEPMVILLMHICVTRPQWLEP